MRHLNYLKYVLKHKWFVFLACRRLNVSLWRAIKHDWHKFLPSEWFPYAKTFYKPDGSKQYVESDEFAKSWNLHQKRADHHWQYWLLTWDKGVTQPIEIPIECVLEMLADWYGAGRAITGKWEAHLWYQKQKDIIKLHPNTRAYVEEKLSLIAREQEKASSIGLVLSPF